MKDEAWGAQDRERICPDGVSAPPLRTADASVGRIDSSIFLADFLLTNKFYPLAPAPSRASPQVVKEDKLKDQMVAGKLIGQPGKGI